MTEEKKQFVAKKIVQQIIDNKLNIIDEKNKNQTSNWSLFGRQTIMINRNTTQMRPRVR